jgi:type III secretion system SsaH family protein
MITLETSLRRLIVEIGLVAVNHGFQHQAKCILSALPNLTDNAHAKNIITATMQIGLGDSPAAMQTIKGDISDEAGLLRRLVASSSR